MTGEVVPNDEEFFPLSCCKYLRKLTFAFLPFLLQAFEAAHTIDNIARLHWVSVQSDGPQDIVSSTTAAVDMAIAL